MRSKNILWFQEIDKHDIPEAGGKGANLGELIQAGMPVPPGFVILSSAYYDHIQKNRIDRLIKKMLSGLNYENTKDLNYAAKTIQREILSSEINPKLIDEIKKAYNILAKDTKSNVPVAIRSSATAEDLPTASFAGQQATFLNISGEAGVVNAVRQCWASLFEPRAIYYRIINKFDHLKVGIAVPVQVMVQSEKAGVLFTIDPVNNDKDVVVIDAAYGLGEAVVSGSVTPDRYYVEKETLKILDKQINRQTWMITKAKNRNGDIHKDVLKVDQKKQKLKDKEILELAKIGIKIENHYRHPQDTEWAIDEKGRIYFVQSRPVTTVTKMIPLSEYEGKKIDQKKVKSILKGAGASVGLASGIVKIIHSPEEIDSLKNGHVLVTEMTNPTYIPAMKRANAIITDTGGITSHAAIVSRELGIPCVVGTGTATHDLKDGMMVTVDGASGHIYKGKIENITVTNHKEILQMSTKESLRCREVAPITATKVYVNLAEPTIAEEIAKQSVDGVGLMRAEFIVAAMGEHPKALEASGRSKKYIDVLVSGMRKICEAFNPRPVVYRTTDFKTNEYRALKGGIKYEPREENPMLGYRGCFRYIKDPQMFIYELDAIKIVRDEYDLKNLWVMLPFVRTVSELRYAKKIIAEAGLEQNRSFKLWMMAEIPSNVILIDKFCDEGIDGVSIGSNDLTQLTLGVDRDSQLLAEEFDERNEAIIRSIKIINDECRKRHITVSCCGQAPSVYPEFTEELVKMGITSVSVNPDKILDTRRLIASIERKIILNKKIR